MRGYFIAGTDTGVGKTRVTTGLLGACAAARLPCLGMKPIASGTDSRGLNEDVARIHAANLACLAASDPQARDLDWLAADNPYCFNLPVSPHLAARASGVAIEPARILEAARTLAAHTELLLVEGSGGWLAPIGPAQTMADVAEALELPVVLVVGLRLGCLNHALLTARAIAAGPLRLAGWIGSQVEDGMPLAQDNLSTLANLLPAPQLGLLPHASHPGGDAQQLRAAGQGLWRDAR